MLRLFYPRYCSLCRSKLQNNRFFCKSCQDEVVLLDPTFRCCHCFEQAEGVCLNCVYDVELQHIRVAYCWEEGHELLSLIRQGLYSRLVSDLLLVQFDRLGWAFPDCVIPLPGRGDNAYIKRFAKKMGVVYDTCLFKQPGSIPQRHLPLNERCKMPFGLLALRQRKSWNQHFLLIDDEIGTYQTVKSAGRLLYMHGARRVDVLVLSRTFAC